MALLIREFEERDVEPCGRICYEAFRSIAEEHGFPPDLPSPEVAVAVLGILHGTPGFYGIVAERDGTVLGSNFLDERNAISGVGPVTVDPKVQDGGIGRRLMEAIVERSDARGFAGMRLVQAAYHSRSLSLYTKLGFASREELAVMAGTPAATGLEQYTVRAATPNDAPACNEICSRVYGFPRGNELRDAIAAGNGFVAERDGEIRAYTSGLGYFGHSVGERTEALCALLASVPPLPSLGVLLPIRDYPLFRWSLDAGMRVLLTMTLMSRGAYQTPDGSYLPSVVY